MQPILTDSPDKGTDAVVQALTALAARGRYAPTTTEIWRELGGPSGVTAAVTAAKRAGLVRTRRLRDTEDPTIRVRYAALKTHAHHLPKAGT